MEQCGKGKLSTKDTFAFCLAHTLSSEGTRLLLKLQWGSKITFLYFKLSYFSFASKGCVILENEGMFSVKNR